MGSKYFFWIFIMLFMNLTNAKSIRGSQTKRAVKNDSTYKIKFVNVDGNEARTSDRQKRSTKGLMDRFLDAYNNPGLQGEVLYIARRELRVTFDFDQELVNGLNIVKGEFYIYKRLPKTLPRRRKSTRPLPPATVSVHQTIRHHRIVGETLPLESRDIQISSSGWCMFDVTTAVQNWANDGDSNRGLEVWVESAESGKMAARVARKTKFVKTRRNKENGDSPTLVIYYSHD